MLGPVQAAIVVLTVLGVLIGLIGFTRYQQSVIDRLEVELSVAQAKARSASATIKLLRAEMESDSKIDDLSDDDLRVAPPIWMREDRPTGR